MLESDLVDIQNAIITELHNPSEKVLLEQIKMRYSDGTVFVTSPNAFVQQHVCNKYRARIAEFIHQASDEQVTIDFNIDNPHPKRGAAACAQPVQMMIPCVSGPVQTSGINPRFTFDDFVVGNSNAFAYQAALAVSENAEARYNPLFFHADIGLGKSHISHAIGNRSATIKPGFKARYLSAREFSQEYVFAVRNNCMEKFKNTYHGSKLDVLFLDDIHLFAKKEKTQLEFAGLMDDLICAGTQVILSGFRPPTQIASLDKGLTSRITSGLVIDIKKPDLLTRAAICHAKAQREGIELRDDVAEFIASQITGNIRELESAVLTITALSSLMKREVNIELAKEALGAANAQPKPITMPHIMNFVAEKYMLRIEDLISASRRKEIVYPRQISMYLCRKFTDETLESIGKAFKRKHTSVMHALEVIDSRYQDNLSVKKEVDFIIEGLKESSTPNS